MSLYIPDLATDDFGPFVQGVASNFNLLDAHTTGLVTQGDGMHGLKIEEGVWTPTLRSSGGIVYTLSSAVGTYIRIGNKLECWFEVSSSTELKDPYYVLVGGLPILARSPLEHVGVASSPQGANSVSSTHGIRYHKASNQLMITNLKVGDVVTRFNYSNTINGYFTYLI